MKRFALWLTVIAMIFSGCAATQDDPFRVDTVVRIPVDPTDAPTIPATEEPTEPPTEIPTKAPTESAATEAPAESAATEAPQKTSSSKGSSSGKGSSGKNEKTKDTEPSATEPPAPPTEAPAEPSYDPSSYSIGSLEYGILAEINSQRTDAGETDLTISGKLSGIAYLRAKEVVTSWSHTRPDGRDYTSALSDYGYGYGAVAELMVSASGSGSVEAVMNKWMGADSHSGKLLSGSFSKVGIGVYRTGGITYVVCLLIG